MSSSTASNPPMPTPLPLELLATLSSPSGVGSVRTWSSAPYPASSPATPLLATASSDKSISIWSLRDFRLLSTITGGHKRSVRCVDWKDWGSSKRQRTEHGSTGHDAKGVMLATGSFDANVGIWMHNAEYSARIRDGDEALTSDATTAPAATRPFQYGVGFDDPAASPPDNADEDNEEWNFSTLLTGPDSEIKSLAFSPPHYSANLLATSSRDKSVWVWEEVEPDEWETIAVLQEHTGDVKCVAWNAGGRKRGPNGDADDDSVVGGREILASGSYDDTIRLWRDVEEEGDWVCVGVLEGHQGTVWGVSWETYMNEELMGQTGGLWQPRLASCSDDLSIRIWRRVLSEAERTRSQQNQATGGQRLPSIIRPASSMERWEEDGALPAVHVRSVYAVDWSSRTGLVVSCGGDGIIAVYKEVMEENEDVVMNGTSEAELSGGEPISSPAPKTKWVVVAQVEAAHEEFEINHVCWALRRDSSKRFEGEEVIVSTGDDGVVRVWTLPQTLL